MHQSWLRILYEPNYYYNMVNSWMQRYSSPPSSMTAPVNCFVGTLKIAATDCEFDVNIDLIQTGIEEPVYLTEVDTNGDFELLVP